MANENDAGRDIKLTVSLTIGVVVVVIGGVVSFPGAVLGGLIAGEILSLTSMIDPSYSQVMLFAVMTLVLVSIAR